jgi:hypothetical protein
MICIGPPSTGVWRQMAIVDRNNFFPALSYSTLAVQFTYHEKKYSDSGIIPGDITFRRLSYHPSSQKRIWYLIHA